MPGAGGLSGMPDARRGRFIRDAGFFTCAPPPPRRPSTAMVRRDSGSSAGSSSSPRDVDGTVACVPSFEALCEAVKREASEYGQGQGPFAIACEGRQLVCGGSIEEKQPHRVTRPRPAAARYALHFYHLILPMMRGEAAHRAPS